MSSRPTSNLEKSDNTPLQEAGLGKIEALPKNIFDMTYPRGKIIASGSQANIFDIEHNSDQVIKEGELNHGAGVEVAVMVLLGHEVVVKEHGEGEQKIQYVANKAPGDTYNAVLERINLRRNPDHVFELLQSNTLEILTHLTHALLISRNYNSDLIVAVSALPY
jgi:hypothetical protein